MLGLGPISSLKGVQSGGAGASSSSSSAKPSCGVRAAHLTNAQFCAHLTPPAQNVRSFAMDYDELGLSEGSDEPAAKPKKKEESPFLTTRVTLVHTHRGFARSWSTWRRARWRAWWGWGPRRILAEPLEESDGEVLGESVEADEVRDGRLGGRGGR